MELFTKSLTALTLVLFFSCQSGEVVIENDQLDTKLSKRVLSEDFSVMGSFTNGIEGPAIDTNGFLYAVNYESQGTVGRVDKEGKGAIFLTLPKGSIGNSIRFNEKGEMFIADYAGHVIYKYDGTLDTLIYEPKMNQPNDIVLTKSGLIYASDPDWKEESGNLWLIRSGIPICLEDSMGTTNGIELNEDDKKLFVNESLQRMIWVYDVGDKGTLSGKSCFHKFQNHGLDGMKYNHKTKELFVARYGAGEIVVLNAKGEFVRSYGLKGKKPTNLAFDKNYTELYVTMQARMGIEVLKL